MPPPWRRANASAIWLRLEFSTQTKSTRSMRVISPGRVVASPLRAARLARARQQPVDERRPEGRGARAEEAEMPEPREPRVLGRDHPMLLRRGGVLGVERLHRGGRRVAVVAHSQDEHRRAEGAMPG